MLANRSSRGAIPVVLLLGGPGWASPRARGAGRGKGEVLGHGMSTSGTELREALAHSVGVSDDALVVDLADGRTITVPLAWFPRLAHGTATERGKLASHRAWRGDPLAGSG